MHKPLLALLIVVLLVLSPGCKTAREEGELFAFQDAALEYAVREYLKKPTGDIMKEDILIFKIFWIAPDQIQLNNGDRIPLPSDLTPQTLADLQNFPNTGSVLVSGGSYEGLDTLGGCEKLQKLGLNTIDNLEDISFLSQLPKLVVLAVHSNPSLKDFSPLAQLDGLLELDLHSCKLEDISFLSGLTSLTDLDLHTNDVKDITALAGLEQLRNLRLEANYISDLTPLSAKSELRTLALDYNEVNSLLPLEYLPAIKELGITHNPALLASQVADLRKTLPEDCKIEWS